MATTRPRADQEGAGDRAPDWIGSAAHILLVGLIGIVVSLFCLFRFGPFWMNTDTPILAVMSLQRVTLFFWGENRFLNLVPFLASPVRQVDWNLLVQICMFGGGFVGFLALLGRVCAIVIFGSRAWLDFYLCFAGLLLGFLTLTSPFAIHVFIVEGQPYGISALLGGAGLWGMLSRRWSRWFVLGPSICALILAGGLNPSLVVVSGAICVVVALFDAARRWRMLVVLPLSSLCFLGWLIYARLVPGPDLYASWADASALWNTGAALAVLTVQAFDGTAYTVGICAALLAGLIVLRLDGSFGGSGILALLLAGFALAWLVLFANNAWVAGNGFHFRYFFPVIIAVVMLVTLPLVGIVMRGGPAVRGCGAVLALAGCLLVIAAPLRSLDDMNLLARAAPRAEAARAAGVRFIVGDFWFVWPVVYRLLRDGDAYGIDGLRDVGNRPGVKRELALMEQVGTIPRAFCVDAAIARCLSQAANLTGRQWAATGDVCGERCDVMVLRMRAQ